MLGHCSVSISQLLGTVTWQWWPQVPRALSLQRFVLVTWKKPYLSQSVDSGNARQGMRRLSCGITDNSSLLFFLSPSRRSVPTLDIRDFFGYNCLLSPFIGRRSQGHRCQAGREQCYPDTLMRIPSCSQRGVPPPPALSFKMAEHRNSQHSRWLFCCKGDDGRILTADVASVSVQSWTSPADPAMTLSALCAC